MKTTVTTRIGPGIGVAAVLLFLIGCPDNDPFGAGDDDDTIAEPVAMTEGWCHLTGSFFRASDVVGAFEEIPEGDPEHGDDLNDIVCDFDGDGTGETYWLHHKQMQWLADETDPEFPNPYPKTYAHHHAGADDPQIAYLNGGHDGVRPILYVGGVNEPEQQVFLWMSYHGSPTFMGYLSQMVEHGPDACAPIWSWNNGGTVLDQSEGLEIPVVADDISGYCAVGPLYTGHATETCKFGFFPLGIFKAHLSDEGDQIVLNSELGTIQVDGGALSFLNISAEYLDDSLAMGTLQQLDCDTDELTVGLALQGSKLQHLSVPSRTFLGTEYHPFDSNDSFKGVDWDGGVGGSALDFEYVTRGVLTDESVLDQMELVQVNHFQFEQDCCPEGS